jgi:hypothetical protein
MNKIVGVTPEVQTGHIPNTSPGFMLEPVYSLLYTVKLYLISCISAALA